MTSPVGVLGTSSKIPSANCSVVTIWYSLSCCILSSFCVVLLSLPIVSCLFEGRGGDLVYMETMLNMFHHPNVVSDLWNLHGTTAARQLYQSVLGPPANTSAEIHVGLNLGRNPFQSPYSTTLTFPWSPNPAWCTLHQDQCLDLLLGQLVQLFWCARYLQHQGSHGLASYLPSPFLHWSVVSLCSSWPSLTPIFLG